MVVAAAAAQGEEELTVGLGVRRRRLVGQRPGAGTLEEGRGDRGIRRLLSPGACRGCPGQPPAGGKTTTSLSDDPRVTPRWDEKETLRL